MTGELLFNPVSGPQERGLNEASHQPQKAQRVGEAPALQNGGYGDTQGTPESKRLDGEGRSQRCLLQNPNTSHSSIVSEVCDRLETFSVYLPTLWLVL